MKLGTNIQHVSGNCWKDFLDERSNVNSITRPNISLRRRYTLRRCGVDAQLSLLFCCTFCAHLYDFPNTEMNIRRCLSLTSYCS